VQPANNGPFYAAGMYPKLAELFREHGYALAVHGSVGSDFDLIAVPWVDIVSDPDEVVMAVAKHFAVKADAGGPSERAHGRRAYKIHLSFADCALDISFTPRVCRLVPCCALEPVVTQGPDLSPIDVEEKPR
jgi:hypothetical protein